MANKYKKVDISTEEGLRYAERLVRKGWKVISAGTFTILLELIK